MKSKQLTKCLNLVIYGGVILSIALALLKLAGLNFIPRWAYIAPAALSTCIVIGAVLYFFYAANRKP